MAITESDLQLSSIDLDDLDRAASAIAARGAAVAQFAAHADYETLAAAQSAGRILIDQLLQERTRILTEGRTARSLQDTLLQNVSDEDRPRSLLGASLLG